MSTSILTSVFAGILYLIALYNIAKIPWYMGWIKTPKYGLEVSMPFHLLGYRALKLISHPTLFLAPHALMGGTLVSLFATYILMDKDSPSKPVLVKTYVAIAIIFGIHAFPERDGVPNRDKGQPLNQIATIVLFLGCSVIYFGYERTGMYISVIPLLGAAVLEGMKPAKWCFQKLMGTAEEPAKSPDGEEPLPRNPKGYSRCPFAKAFDINKDMYPIKSKDQ